MLDDEVILTDGIQKIHGTVRGISPWRYIFVEAKDGSFYLEVCFDRSFISWSRLVLLEPWVRADNHDQHLMLAENIAYSPDRKNVDDVAGAVRFCAPAMKLQRIASAS